MFGAFGSYLRKHLLPLLHGLGKLAPAERYVRERMVAFSGGLGIPLTYLVVLFDLLRGRAEPFFGVRLPVTAQDFGYLLVVLGACGATVALGWRCSCALYRADAELTNGRSRHPLVLFFLAGLALVAEHSLRVTESMPQERAVGLVVVICAGAVTQFGFMAAAAMVEAEFRDFKTGGLLLTVAHHLGGFGGIALARRLFRDSPALAQFRPEFPWAGRALLMLGFILLAFSISLPQSLLRWAVPPFKVIAPDNSDPFPELPVPEHGGAPPANHLPGMPPGFTSPFK